MTQSLSPKFTSLNIIGSDVRGSAEDRQCFTIDGREPREVVFPQSIAHVSEALQTASEQHLAVAPVGQGAFLHLGNSPRRYDWALCLRQLARIVDYQPTDMTVSVEAGMTLARLQEILGEHDQWLPIDPPRPGQATVGGIIAANLSGPARLSQGTIRDFLLGLTVVRADGTVIKGGGRVVKNVAGYDLPKLYCGSLGTLGVIVEATFKVRPRPQAQTLLSLPFSSIEQAMECVSRLLGSELQPFFLELANGDPFGSVEAHLGDSVLFVGFAGLREDVSYQCARFRDLITPDGTSLTESEGEAAHRLHRLLYEFPLADEASLRCKISLLPTQVAAFCKKLTEEAALRRLPVQLLIHAGNGIVSSRFARPESVPPVQLLSFVDWLRISAKQAGGYVVVEQIASALKDRIDVWGQVGNAFPLMKKLKETLDPQAMLNPGRFVGGI